MSIFNPDNLSDVEKLIYDEISLEEKCVDELHTLTGLSVDSLLSYLTTLELKGIIKQVHGDRYRKV